MKKRCVCLGVETRGVKFLVFVDDLASVVVEIEGLKRQGGSQQRQLRSE
jgi:hypothetical protein